MCYVGVAFPRVWPYLGLNKNTVHTAVARQPPQQGGCHLCPRSMHAGYNSTYPFNEGLMYWCSWLARPASNPQQALAYSMSNPWPPHIWMKAHSHSTAIRYYPVTTVAQCRALRVCGTAIRYYPVTTLAQCRALRVWGINCRTIVPSTAS
jgi:hypothetical protein